MAMQVPNLHLTSLDVREFRQKNAAGATQASIINGVFTGDGSGLTSVTAAATWGSIGGTLSSQTDLNTALGLKADASALTSHTSSTSNPHSVTKAQVGLGSVDNTSDTAKPVSTATQTALNLKADSSTLTSHTSNVSNPHSVTKAQVGLGNCDNTSDANKPVSTATQTALDLKANLSGGNTFSGVQTFQNDFFMSTNSSSHASPRTFGFSDLTTTEAIRVQFGDAYNAFQLAWDHRLVIYGYHGIEIRGGRKLASSPSFTVGAIGEAGLMVINERDQVGLHVRAHSTQTNVLTKWTNSSDTTLASMSGTGALTVTGLTNSGNASITGTMTTNGVIYNGSVIQPVSTGQLLMRFIPKGANRTLFQAFNSDYLADGTNYEVLEMGYDVGRNFAIMASLKGGTGTARPIKIQVGGITGIMIQNTGGSTQIGFNGRTPVARPTFYRGYSSYSPTYITNEWLFNVLNDICDGLSDLGLFNDLGNSYDDSVIV